MVFHGLPAGSPGYISRSPPTTKASCCKATWPLASRCSSRSRPSMLVSHSLRVTPQSSNMRWVPAFELRMVSVLAIIAVAGAHGKDPTLMSFKFRDALPVLNPALGKVMLILFAIGSIAPACFCSFIIGNSLSTMLGSEKTRIPLTLGGATIGIILAALGVAGNLEAFFGLIGASFGPVIGAMIADYLLSGRKWAGPRAGISIPGYAAWVIGFIVGVQNHPWVDVLPGWDISAVYSLIAGFLVYLILAKLGLEPRKVEVANLALDQEEAGAEEATGG